MTMIMMGHVPDAPIPSATAVPVVQLCAMCVSLTLMEVHVAVTMDSSHQPLRLPYAKPAILLVTVVHLPPVAQPVRKVTTLEKLLTWDVFVRPVSLIIIH